MLMISVISVVTAQQQYEFVIQWGSEGSGSSQFNGQNGVDPFKSFVAMLLPFVTILIIQLSIPQFVYVTGQILNTTKTSASFDHYDNNTISTRGHFDYLATGELIPEHNSTDYQYYNGISGNTNDSIQNEIMCPFSDSFTIHHHKDIAIGNS
jgi:hypothetical protein